MPGIAAPAPTHTPLKGRRDPRAVLPWIAVVTVLAFALSHPAYLGALAVATWAVVAISAPWDSARSYLLFALAGGAMIMMINPLFGQMGTTALWHSPAIAGLGPLVVTAESIAFALGMASRLAAVAGAFALYSLSVDQDALFRLLAPFSPRSAILMALSVRLLPTMTRDMGRIMDAQRSRGRRLDSGRLRQRVAARIPILDSLLATSLERAVGIAESMESRGYGRSGRTRTPARRLSPGENAAIALACLLLLFGLVVALGPARYAYYPTLPNPAGAADLAGASALGLAVAAAALAPRRWSPWRW